MNLKDISEINFSNNLNQIGDYKWRESFVEFTALRFYPLLRH